MAPPRKTRRRSPGEGGAFSYMTKLRKDPADTGLRWFWKAPIRMPDGTTKIRTKSGFLTKEAALAAMQEAMVSGRKGTYVEPSKRTVGDWLDEWTGTLRHRPSTIASYRKNIRLHVKPYIGDLPLASLTSTRLTRLYRELEANGRRDGKGEPSGAGLSARTVRYIHTIIGAALAAAVEAEPPLLTRNPAAKAIPPSAQEAQAPEQHPWTASQLRAYLNWARGNSDLYPTWYVLAYTGIRRGELLALRWRDVDLNAATMSIQRTAGIVRNAGEGARIEEGPAKTKKSRRVIDIDPATVAVLKSWKRERGELSLALARPDALVFSTLEGQHLHPERYWRSFKSAQARCRETLGDDAPPEISVHDLRHTHATLLLSAGEPVKTVSERLGHANVGITLAVYAHVLPGDQKRAASRFAALVEEAI